MDASTPLLVGKRRRRSGRRRAFSAAGVLVLSSLGIAVNLRRRAPPIPEELDHVVEDPPQQVKVKADEAIDVEVWNATTEGRLVDVEEHYVFSTTWRDYGRSSHIFVKQAYTYWRYGLNGPRRLRDPSSRSLRVTSYRYNTKKALMEKLDDQALSAGALVFLSVTTMALDSDMRDYDILQEMPYNLSIDENFHQTWHDRVRYGKTRLDLACVYQHTPNILLRSSLLRALLAYPKPLVLFLAGDSGCRLTKELLPKTHHLIIFPNDGAPANLRPDVLWYPEGLEGLEDAKEDYYFWKTKASYNAMNMTDSEAPTLDERTYLLDVGASINGRKPSRLTMLRWLEDEGGREALEALANDEGLNLRFNASVIDEPLVDGTSSPEFRYFSFETINTQQGAAIFALAPAGDTWSSGRILEAMLQGSIPVVDATYVSDGGASAKGCDNAAAFWRHGGGAFQQGAPFIFVEEWRDLPRLLRDALANVKDRLDAVETYRDDLERYLRGAILDGALDRQHTTPSSSCRTDPLSEAALESQIILQAAYYRSNWVQAFRDVATLPTAGCSTDFHPHFMSHNPTPMLMPHAGIQCYAPACAPPLVGAFSCEDIS